MDNLRQNLYNEQDSYRNGGSFMKLNTKRTVLVGFAFLSICAFWQMYDNLVPKILTETFDIDD